MASLRGRSTISASVAKMTNAPMQSPIKEIALDDLVPYHREGGNTPIFRDYSEERMKELAQSLREHGQMDSITVFQSKVYAGKYEILAGKQRTRAAKYNAEHYDNAPKTIRAEVIETNKVAENNYQYGDLLYVNTNVYRREELFPSELALAYEMQAKAMSHQGANSGAQYMLDEIASKSNTSVSYIRTVRRIIPDHCIAEFISMVDDKILPMSPTALYLTRFGTKETNLINQRKLYEFVAQLCNGNEDAVKRFFAKHIKTATMSALKDKIAEDEEKLLRDSHLEMLKPQLKEETPTLAFKSPSKKVLQEIIPAEMWSDPVAATDYLRRAKQAMDELNKYIEKYGTL